MEIEKPDPGVIVTPTMHVPDHVQAVYMMNTFVLVRHALALIQEPMSVAAEVAVDRQVVVSELPMNLIQPPGYALEGHAARGADRTGLLEERLLQLRVAVTIQGRFTSNVLKTLPFPGLVCLLMMPAVVRPSVSIQGTIAA